MTTLREAIGSAVRSASAVITATLVATPATLKGLYIRSTGTAGTVVLKDGGSGGTTLLTINTPAAVGWLYMPLPGAGMVFATDIHATLTNADGVTAFYA